MGPEEMKEHFLGNQERREVTSSAVGNGIGQAVAERPSRVVARYFKTLHVHGKRSSAIFFR